MHVCEQNECEMFSTVCKKNTQWEHFQIQSFDSEHWPLTLTLRALWAFTSMPHVSNIALISIRTSLRTFFMSSADRSPTLVCPVLSWDTLKSWKTRNRMRKKYMDTFIRCYMLALLCVLAVWLLRYSEHCYDVLVSNYAVPPLVSEFIAALSSKNWATD